MAARRATRDISLDFAFFVHLADFYQAQRGTIRRHYRELTRRFLDYNHPDNSHAYLRQPQFEALEIYVFLKEYLDNAPLHEVFRAWADRTGRFTERGPLKDFGGRQYTLFEQPTREDYEAVFKNLRRGRRIYPNYIFALTMGTGKTILMATCIFYEFILANKWPKDPKYCHNALVFAPDTTVLQSLREIKTMDMTLVVPPEYVNFLERHIRYHFLDQAGTALSTQDGSRFNVVISNTQKIILKKRHQDPSPAAQIFKSEAKTHVSTYQEELMAMYDLEPTDETDLLTNQRFQKLQRLPQLGVYIDEAHHAFGNQLERDMGIRKTKTSLARTVDELAASLAQARMRVVACYNYTGTPYVKNRVLPEVVYAYSLQAAIQAGYLKQVRIHGYTNPRSAEFIDLVVDHFQAAHSPDARYEGMRPKLAFFAATIKELQEDLRPAVEAALRRHGVSTERILVNVGDEKLTSNDDIREFNRLDTPGSEKQYILLVGKGREGWNCRSLFGVALFRKPRSRVFVLQATMRCLRSITEAQQVGQVYLSDENIQILDAELQQNFRITAEELGNQGQERTTYQITVKQPVAKVKLTRLRREYHLEDRAFEPGLALGLDDPELTQKYRLIHTEYEGIPLETHNRQYVQTEDITHRREQYAFSELTLVAEVARYLNRPCLEIRRYLAQTEEGLAGIVAGVNQYNALLYDVVIPQLFRALYTLTEHETTEDYEVDLVKVPPEGHYQVSAGEGRVVHERDAQEVLARKSFHLDPYCFDSNPERDLFWDLLRDGRVTQIYFTGMLTHGQSDFYIQYIDPDSHTVRSYYPDFLVQKADGGYLIVEVKGDNKVDDPVVQAKKEFAHQIAVASGMSYEIIKGSDAQAGRYGFLLEAESVEQARYGTEGVL